MDTTAKEELRALVEELDEGDAAEVLAYARWLLDKEPTSRPDARTAS